MKTPPTLTSQKILPSLPVCLVSQWYPTLFNPMDSPPWEFSRQKYWSGLPCPPPGNLPDPGIKPGLLHYRQILYHLSRKESLNKYKHRIGFVWNQIKCRGPRAAVEMVPSATVTGHGLHEASGPNTEVRSQKHCPRLEGMTSPPQASCLHLPFLWRCHTGH